MSISLAHRIRRSVFTALYDCLTFSGRTAETIVGAADGISGGMIPDQFVLYIISAILAFVTLVVGLVLTNKKKGN